jgi:hypothetical protein
MPYVEEDSLSMAKLYIRRYGRTGPLNRLEEDRTVFDHPAQVIAEEFVFPQRGEMIEMNTDTPSETEAETETKTKLDAGRQNPVKTRFTFRANDAVPLDANALYSYLLVQAEQHYFCSTPDDVVAMFEAEFASPGAVPELIATTVADRLTENGIAEAPPGDDLHQDALVVLFVDEYTSAFAAEPSTLPDPRGIPVSATPPGRGGLVERLWEWFENW